MINFFKILFFGDKRNKSPKNIKTVSKNRKNKNCEQNRSHEDSLYREMKVFPSRGSNTKVEHYDFKERLEKYIKSDSKFTKEAKMFRTWYDSRKNDVQITEDELAKEWQEYLDRKQRILDHEDSVFSKNHQG